MDVKSAFLNGVLEEEVYVDHPKGFEIEGSENKVYKLIRALYGLNKIQKLGIVQLTLTSLSVVLRRVLVRQYSIPR